MNQRASALLQYLIARGREPSTWRGLVLVLTALCGWKVPEEKAAAVALIGLLVAGLVGAAFPDKPKDPPA